MNLRKYVEHMPIILCGADVIVENSRGEIPLLSRRDNGMWGIAGVR